MIQTAKRRLLIILGSQNPSLVAFTTILGQLMLNYRALTHVADRPENEESLTSNQFLHRSYASTLCIDSIPTYLLELVTALTSTFVYIMKRNSESDKPHMEAVAKRIPPYSLLSREVVDSPAAAKIRQSCLHLR